MKIIADLSLKIYVKLSWAFFSLQLDVWCLYRNLMVSNNMFFLSLLIELLTELSSWDPTCSGESMSQWYGDCSFLRCGPYLWNGLPLDLRTLEGMD
jgi:hypothetical protein